MIDEINIHGIATFSEPTTIKPLKINFCYGSNGTGKTTISNVISKGETVSWRRDTRLQTLVYNRNFMNENFGETSKIRGVFTLGKDSKDAQEFIAEQRTGAEECDRQIDGFTGSKERLVKEQKERVANFHNTCWKVKGKYEGNFGKAFEGLNKSKEKFANTCLDKFKKASASAPILDDLRRQYETAFDEARSVYEEFTLIDVTAIRKWEKCDLLSRKISGSADTPIGKFVEYLGNSDWVKRGMSYADKAKDKCPFCQQVLPHDTYKDIEAFFDDSYERDLNQIKDFLERYRQKSDELLEMLRSYNDTSLPTLDYSLFKAECDALDSKIAGNVRKIESKVSSPSIAVELETLEALIDKINTVLASFNKNIAESNDFVRNQKQKQAECINGVWHIIVSELKTVINTFNTETKGNTAAIDNRDVQIGEQTKQRDAYHRLIKEKEATLTSVKPTAAAINSLLASFGFEGFSLVENPDEVGTYKIIRNDGKNAEKTLSEGEHNFICFLYFYHLVYGSQDRTGAAQSKVVVIDDPISSLDSNVLFIVSTLTGEIIDDCEHSRKGIKQVFILTHNVYFHKEVTLLGRRKKWNKKGTTFWVVKKNNNISDVILYDNNENPIKSSYELLWLELKDTERAQRITIFNTLRRILEYYFDIIGGIDYKKCINRFDGEDKAICRSLIARINDGSHFITDDFDFVSHYDNGEELIRVFKLIFEKMGHSSHYNMMMGIEDEVDPEIKIKKELTRA